MSLNNVPAGKDLPNDFNVVIEIPMNGDPVKYEVDKESGAIFVDRFMSTAMHYPCNYGYIPQTLSDDGDPVDVLVVTPIPLPTGVVVRCRTVGVLKMTDEAGGDAKLLAVPVDKLLPTYKSVQKPQDLPELLLQQEDHGVDQTPGEIAAECCDEQAAHARAARGADLGGGGDRDGHQDAEHDLARQLERREHRGKFGSASDLSRISWKIRARHRHRAPPEPRDTDSP